MAKPNGQTLDDKLAFWAPKIEAFKAMPAADIVKDIRSLALLISDSVPDLMSYNAGASKEVNSAIQKLNDYRTLFVAKDLEKLGEVYDNIVPPHPKRNEKMFGDWGNDIANYLSMWRPGEKGASGQNPGARYDFSEFMYRLNIILYLFEIGNVKSGENIEQLQKMMAKKPEDQKQYT